MRLIHCTIIAAFSLSLLGASASAERRAPARAALANRPARAMQGLAKVQTTWQADVNRAFTRYNRAKAFGPGFAHQQLVQDIGYANLKAWQDTAKHTVSGALIRASFAPFQGVFGGVQLPGPMQYSRLFTRALQYELNHD